MAKLIFTILAIVICSASAAPEAKPGVLAAPVVAPAVVTAQSSQVIARNYNGLVAPVVAAAPLVRAAPIVAAPAAPLLAAPHYHHPYVAAQYVAAPSLYF